MKIRFRMKHLTPLMASLAVCALSGSLVGAEKLTVLLIDGQNNHAWQETTPVMVKILKDSGRFDVTVSTSPAGPPKAPKAPGDKSDEAKAAFSAEMKAWEMAVAEHKKGIAAAWEQWRPQFASYDVVVSNYNGEPWPEEVKLALEEYVKGGGGFVPVHAANNSFPEWPAYNEMIGIGGWGGRSELSGPYLRLRGDKWINDSSVGKGGSHGQQHEFVVVTQNAEHPIMKGLPTRWKHAKDELYDRLRGPATSVNVLAAARSEEATGGSGEWEPSLMVIRYGNGRVFHTTLGHSTESMSGLGFQETLKRGVEWAATGEVTFPAIDAAVLTEEKVATVPAN